MIRRYNFQHYPDKAPLPGSNESPRLAVGVFNGIQIDEMTVYNDGVIVTARADTAVLDEFMDDIYDYLGSQFSFIKIQVPTETRHYESTVLVELDPRASRKFDFLQGLYNDLSGFRAEYGHGEGDYSFFGLEADVEPGGGPLSKTFGLQRRLGTPYGANQWWSTGPLKTKDHTAVLSNLEKQLLL